MLLLDAEAGHAHIATRRPPTLEAFAGAWSPRGSAAQRPRAPLRRMPAAPPTARGSSCSPISASLDDAALAVARRAPRARACCAPNSCSSTAPTAPVEDEQLAAYQAIADALGGPPGHRPPARYRRRQARALSADARRRRTRCSGVRGIRVGAGASRAARDADPRDPARPAGGPVPDHGADGRERRRAARGPRSGRPLRGELGVDGRSQLGVMIETPAAAMTADLIAAEADFLSIGTNDLTQYALAMDRGNPAVAAGVDALHPAVLRLIAESCRRRRRRRAAGSGVCGGLASDPAAHPDPDRARRHRAVGRRRASSPKPRRWSAALDARRCRALAAQALAAARRPPKSARSPAHSRSSTDAQGHSKRCSRSAAR